MEIYSKKYESFTKWYEQIHENGGVILIDKGKDWTSFDVCAKLRGMLRIKKVGHAGTLDPLATGLLIICVGRATKTMTEYQAMEKEYNAIIKLGATTKTDDSEADEENAKPTEHLNNDEISKAISSFIGEIDQIPPMYSAKKVKGQRLYKLARKGDSIELEPSRVTIYDITVNSIENPIIDADVKCSKGTYIRSLARDIGSKLEVGGYLKDLRRTAIGEYMAENALTIEELQEIINKEINKIDK
jgi:tRNA pseudouridine55 synthase